MTDQHVPHAPLSPKPLWRRVISLPQTSLGWLSVVLIGVPVALFFFGVIVYEEKLIEVPGWVGAILGAYGLMTLSLLAGAVVGLIALIQFIRLRQRNKARSGVSISGGRRTSLPIRPDSSPLLSTSTVDSSEGNQALSHASTKPTLEITSKWNSPLTRFSKMAVPLPNSLT